MNDGGDTDLTKHHWQRWLRMLHLHRGLSAACSARTMHMVSCVDIQNFTQNMTPNGLNMSIFFARENRHSQHSALTTTFLGSRLSPDGTAETLVLLGIIVLQGDLQLYRLGELSLLLLRASDDSLHALIERVPSDLTAGVVRKTTI